VNLLVPTCFVKNHVVSSHGTQNRPARSGDALGPDFVAASRITATARYNQIVIVLGGVEDRRSIRCGNEVASAVLAKAIEHRALFPLQASLY
jgi:hypothetical protein